MCVEKNVIFLLVFGFVNLLIVNGESKFQTIRTESGFVKGIHATSSLGRKYFSFRGIPYMKALRFREPQKAEKWSKTFDATKEPPSFPQFDIISSQMIGQEDAGVINVYTPYIYPKKLLPVMVFIHGGGFQVRIKTTILQKVCRFNLQLQIFLTFQGWIRHSILWTRLFHAKRRHPCDF